MAGTAVKIDGTEVALGNPGGTVVNITLRHESSVAYLCRGAADLVRRKADAKEGMGGARSRCPRGGQQQVLGGTLILLGAVCIGLGVISSLAPSPSDTYYYSYYYYNRAFRNGVPFWMGSLFILSGTSSMVSARHGGNWVHLATFLNLGSVVAGSVAFTLGLTDIPPLDYQADFVPALCKRGTEEYRGYQPWGATTSPPYDDSRDQDRVRKCQKVLWTLVRMWTGTQILLLILHCAALAVALFCFGYGLRRMCCSCWGGWKDYVAVEDADAPPAPEEPGKERNPA